VVRAPGAALATRLSCGARSLGIERSWWRREWRERELITLVTGYNLEISKIFFFFFFFRSPEHTHTPQTPTRTTRTKRTEPVYGSVSLSATRDRIFLWQMYFVINKNLICFNING